MALYYITLFCTSKGHLLRIKLKCLFLAQSLLIILWSYFSYLIFYHCFLFSMTKTFVLFAVLCLVLICGVFLCRLCVLIMPFCLKYSKIHGPKTIDIISRLWYSLWVYKISRLGFYILAIIICGVKK